VGSLEQTPAVVLSANWTFAEDAGGSFSDAVLRNRILADGRDFVQKHAAG